MNIKGLSKIGKNEIAKHCCEEDHNFSWDQKRVVGRESMKIPKKIKETINSINHINKISYMLSEIYVLIYGSS